MIREQGFRPVSLSRPGGGIIVPDPAGLVDTLRDVILQHGERGKVNPPYRIHMIRLLRLTRYLVHPSLVRMVSPCAKRPKFVNVDRVEMRESESSLLWLCGLYIPQMGLLVPNVGNVLVCFYVLCFS